MMNEIMPLKFHEIAIASPFETCFYCSGSLPAQTKEHIFNACLGGKHKTSQLICDECNKAFSEIDDSLFSYVQFVMNALGIKGERHREIPVIVSNTDRYVLKEFAKPEIAEPILEVIEDDNGNEKRVKLNAKSKSEARRQLLDGQLEERLGRQLTEPERETILKHITYQRCKGRN